MRLKLLLALFLARYLEMVPMACIGGILLYVSTAMVKPAEVKQVLAHNAFHISLMVYTAVVVVLTDFLIGVVDGDRSLGRCSIASSISLCPCRSRRRRAFEG